MNLAKNPANRFVKFSILVLSTLLGQNLYAASSITAPDNIIVVGINDQVIKSSLLKKTKEYKVNSGRLSLIVRYQAYFEDNLNHHDIVKSDILRLDIPQIQDNQRYVLKLINPPKDHDDAKKYAEQPQIGLFDENNQQVVQELKVSSQPKSSILGGLLGHSVALTQVESTSMHDQVDNRPAQKANSSAVSHTEIVQNSQMQPLDQTMIQMWQKASKAERQKFMTWLAEQ